MVAVPVRRGPGRPSKRQAAALVPPVVTAANARTLLAVQRQQEAEAAHQKHVVDLEAAIHREEERASALQVSLRAPHRITQVHTVRRLLESVASTRSLIARLRDDLRTLQEGRDAFVREFVRARSAADNGGVLLASSSAARPTASSAASTFTPTTVPAAAAAATATATAAVTSTKRKKTSSSPAVAVPAPVAAAESQDVSRAALMLRDVSPTPPLYGGGGTAAAAASMAAAAVAVRREREDAEENWYLPTDRCPLCGSLTVFRAPEARETCRRSRCAYSGTILPAVEATMTWDNPVNFKEMQSECKKGFHKFLRPYLVGLDKIPRDAVVRIMHEVNRHGHLTRANAKTRVRAALKATGLERYKAFHNLLTRVALRQPIYLISKKVFNLCKDMYFRLYVGHVKATVQLQASGGAQERDTNFLQKIICMHYFLRILGLLGAASQFERAKSRKVYLKHDRAISELIPEVFLKLWRDYLERESRARTALGAMPMDEDES